MIRLTELDFLGQVCWVRFARFGFLVAVYWGFDGLGIKSLVVWVFFAGWGFLIEVFWLG